MATCGDLRVSRNVTDPNGHTTTSVYDGFGRLAETVQPDPNGNGGTNYPETFYVYDAGGQLVEKVAPAGPASAPNSVQQVTAYQYDDLGRQTTVSQLDGTISSSTTTDAYGVTHLVYSGTTELTTSYGYDADGDQMTVTDPLLQVTTYQYDRLNRLVKEIQPSPDGVAAAPVTQYTYDNDGNKLTETDPDENVTTFGYNSLNQLTSQSQTIALYLDGSTPVTTTAITGYQYDGDGNVVQETDADGQVTVFAYDALNRQTGQQWYANATDAAHSSDPSDVIVYTYDLDSELHSAADDYSSYTYTYNSLGQQTSVDNAGTPGVPEVLLSSGYDAAGNRTSLSATIGSTADFVNIYSYDALNRETQVTQGTSTIAGHDGVDSKLVNFTYNADGQLASIDRFNNLTGPASDRVASSAYGYDDFGRLTSLTHTAADGTTTYAAYSWTYDAASQVKSFTNSANIADYSAENVATYSYDHDGQLTGATPPSGQTANGSNSLGNVYDANGNATSLNGAGTTIGAGDTLLFDGTYYDTYDANGNLIEQAPLAPNSSTAYIATATAYNPAGLPYLTTDNAGNVTETLYDDAGRVVITIQNYVAAGINGTISATDSDAQVAAELQNTDTSEDIITKYDYDSFGRLATMVVYDATGSGSVQEQATEYLYTSEANRSWQTGVVYPDSTDILSQDSNGVWTVTGTDHTSTTYDELGDVVTATDQRGVVHTYVYDTAGRLSLDEVTSLGTSGLVDCTVLSIGTTYDDLGRVQFVTSYFNADGTGTIVNQVEDQYDGWGNLAQEWQSPSGAVGTGTTPSVQYAYVDGATDGVAAYLRLSQTTYPNGRTVAYNYPAGVDDVMSRLGSITDSDGTVDAAYTYLGLGTIAKEDYQQAGVSLNYDPSGNNSYTGLDRFGQVADQLWSSDAGGPADVLDGYSYTYDPAGNVLSKTNATDAALSEVYDYNAMNELTDWYVGGSTTPTSTWSLDSLGNNLSAGTYNAANEETPTAGSSGYDLAGNMTTLQSGDTAIYDAWNRLVEVDNASGAVEKYAYDGMGRCVQISNGFIGGTPGTVTDDYYAGQQVVESDVTTGGVRNGGYQYLWSPRYIDAPILRDTLTADGSGIVAADRIFYLGDANFNVTAVVGFNQSANGGAGAWHVAERYSYTPYGVVTVRDAGWNAITGNVSRLSNTILYTGHEFSFATHLYYCRARYYDASLERFINFDPLSSDPNLYRYCGDSPVLYVDPTGLEAAGSEPPGEATVSDRTVVVNKDLESKVNFLGTTVDVRTLIPSVTVKVMTSPVDCCEGGVTKKGTKWSAYIIGSVITQFAGAKQWGWKDLFGGRFYQFTAQVSLTGRAGATFVGGASGIACPPAVMPSSVAVSASASSSTTLTGSVHASVGNWSFVGFVTGSLASRIMVSATVNLQTADLSNFSISSPTLSGGADAYGFLTVPIKGGDRTYQVHRKLF